MILPLNHVRSLLFLLSGVLWLTGCSKREGDATWWSDERQRVELSQALELQKLRCDQLVTHELAELKKLENGSVTRKTSLVTLRREHAELSEQVAALESKWPEIRTTILRNQRQRALGQTFETLTLGSGRKFEKVSVSMIDDAGVTLRHREGSARVGFANLSEEQRVAFGMEADLVLAAHEKEASDAIAYERWINSRIATNLAKEPSVIVPDFKPAPASNTAPVAYASNVSPLRQPATSLGSGRSSYDRYSINRNNCSTYHHVYYAAPSCGIPTPTRLITFPVQPNSYRNFCEPAVIGRRQNFSDFTMPSNP